MVYDKLGCHEWESFVIKTILEPLHVEINSWQHKLDVLYKEAVGREHFNPKTVGGGWRGSICPLPCGFSKYVSSKEMVKALFFVTFNIILRHIFAENFIECPQVVQKI